MLKNKVALVTGTGSGIGEATALPLGKNGAAVVLSDKDEASGQRVLQAVQQAGGKACFVKGDVSIPADRENMVNEAEKRFGHFDIAVNNAGIAGPGRVDRGLPAGRLEQGDRSELNGVFFGMRYQIPALLKTGGGSIVNIARILGQVGFATANAYVAA